MILFSPEAEAQIDGLLEHYERLDRIEATGNLITALDAAARRLEHASGAGLAAPRPYPALAALGLRWIKEGPYWIAYDDTGRSLVIVGVYHETADIPNRV